MSKPRKNQWVYHYEEVGAIAAIKLYGTEKLIGKIVRSASKYGSIKDISWYYVEPIFAFGNVNAMKSRWFAYSKVRIVCRPIKIYKGVAIKQKTECDNCQFRFACWTIK